VGRLLVVDDELRGVVWLVDPPVIDVERTGRVCSASTGRALSNPVAMTVIFISFCMCSFGTVPKIILASGSEASWMTFIASSTS